MITTLSAFKEMILASSGGKTNPWPGSGQNVEPGNAGTAASPAEQGAVMDSRAPDAVSVELSASHDVFAAVDDYFNLGRSGRFEAFHALSRDDKEQFVKIVVELAKSGYMGYEELIVNNKVERHEITSKIGDRRLSDAKVYDRPRNPHR